MKSRQRSFRRFLNVIFKAKMNKKLGGGMNKKKERIIP